MLCSRSVSSCVASPRVHSLKSPSTTFGPVTRRSCTMRREPLGLVRAARETPCRGGRCTGGACRPSRSMSTRWQQRGSHVFHDRSYWAWCEIGKRLRTTLPNSVPRRCRVGAMTQPMPSAAPSSSAWPSPRRPGADHFLQRDDVGVDGAAAPRRCARVACGRRARGSDGCCRWRRGAAAGRDRSC